MLFIVLLRQIDDSRYYLCKINFTNALYIPLYRYTIALRSSEVLTIYDKNVVRNNTFQRKE